MHGEDQRRFLSAAAAPSPVHGRGERGVQTGHIGQSADRAHRSVRRDGVTMPWGKDVAADRKRFIELWKTRRYSVVELAMQFRVSERCAHATIRRFEAGGWKGLQPCSRARLSQERTDEGVIDDVIEARRRHPTWGPRKLKAFLERTAPDVCWPAASTMGDHLQKAGLVLPRRRRRARVDPTRPCVDATAPNESWSVDHKGWFRLGNGERCTPLTVTDNCSRKILGCEATTSTGHDEAWAAMLKTFREHGLPRAVRSDNGSPFAGSGLTRLSAFSVKLIKLGVVPDFIAPGKPQQNGRHERMHRTLKQETASPPASSSAAQQLRFDAFIKEFNEERPHEALNNDVPSSVHRQSTREMPTRLPKVDYDNGVTTRAVNQGGCFKWASEFIFLAEPLAGERVAFDLLDDGLHLIRFGEQPVALFDELTKKLRPSGVRRTKPGLTYVTGLRADP